MGLDIDADALCAPPEVCGADAEASRVAHLASQRTDAGDGRLKAFLKRDKPLLVAIAVLVFCMNAKRLHYVLYPFSIFR